MLIAAPLALPLARFFARCSPLNVLARASPHHNAARRFCRLLREHAAHQIIIAFRIFPLCEVCASAPAFSASSRTLDRSRRLVSQQLLQSKISLAFVSKYEMRLFLVVLTVAQKSSVNLDDRR